MKHIKLFEDFDEPDEDVIPSEDENGIYNRLGKGEISEPISKKGKYTVTVITEEAIKRHEKNHPGEPISANNIGVHFSPRSYDEAVKLKKELEEGIVSGGGWLKGETIKKVFLSPESDGMGRN